jgi:hypothetical protein
MKLDLAEKRGGAQKRQSGPILAILAATILVLSGCEFTQQQASNSPETSPTSETSPTLDTSPSTTPSSSSGPLSVSKLPFHDGEVGLSYAAVTLGAVGGVPPYAWSISSGTFPPGLTLSSGGNATGNDTAAGKFSFIVKVTDSVGTTATKSAGVTVYAALAITQPCATRCTIGVGCTRCGGFGTVSRGLGPYAYSIVGGAVPRGMTRTALSLKGGFPAGTYGLSVLVTDQLGAKATVGANWSIYGQATLSKGGDCIDTVRYPPSCSLRWTYSGGHPSVAPKLTILGYSQNCNAQGVCSTPTAPPPGWKVSVAGGVVNISAAGSGCVTFYIGTVRLALVDTTKCATPRQSNEQDLKVDLEYSC